MNSELVRRRSALQQLDLKELGKPRVETVVGRINAAKIAGKVQRQENRGPQGNRQSNIIALWGPNSYLFTNTNTFLINICRASYYILNIIF